MSAPNKLLGLVAMILALSSQAQAYQFIVCSPLVEGRTSGTFVSLGGTEFNIIGEEDEKSEKNREYTFAAYTKKTVRQTYEPRTVVVSVGDDGLVRRLEPKKRGAVLETVRFEARYLVIADYLFKGSIADSTPRQADENNAQLFDADDKLISNFTCHRVN